MKRKIKIKNIHGNLIFEYECKNNTTKKTVEKAVREGISLAYAKLSYCDLSNINLSSVNLEHADLTFANLSGTDLRNANLSNAILFYANLMIADLSHAVLSGANCYSTLLTNANLSGVDLRNANLNYAKLIGTNLNGAIINYPLNIPEGEFIAWKKVFDYKHNDKPYIIKLKVLADSKRSRATSDKCRCDKALVLEIQDIEGNKLNLTEIVNYAYAFCTYKVGKIVYSDSWDEDRWDECSHGIHFFLDRQNAVNYQ